METAVDVCKLDRLVEQAVNIISKSECEPNSERAIKFNAMVSSYYFTLLCADSQNAFKVEFNESQAADIRKMWLELLWE